MSLTNLPKPLPYRLPSAGLVNIKVRVKVYLRFISENRNPLWPQQRLNGQLCNMATREGRLAYILFMTIMQDSSVALKTIHPGTRMLILSPRHTSAHNTWRGEGFSSENGWYVISEIVFLNEYVSFMAIYCSLALSYPHPISYFGRGGQPVSSQEEQITLCM